jgi:hypothetical protein
MALMATQVLLATARPKAAAPGEAPGRRRVAWLWAHRCGAAATIALAIAALFTGLKVSKARGVGRAPAFARALAVWFASLGGGAAAREAARAAAAAGAARASAAGEDKEAAATPPPRGEAAAAVMERRWALAAVACFASARMPEASVAAASSSLAEAGLPSGLMVDCSHGNSQKDHRKQPLAAAEVCRQVAAGSRRVFGVMVESHLVGGNQKEGPLETLVYGQSITDACLSWEDTVPVLEQLAAAVRARRKH